MLLDTALDVVITAAIWIAALLQLAVLRDQDLPESRLADSGRWLVTAGLMGLGARFTFLLADGGDVRVPLESMLSVLGVALGAIATALDRLVRPPLGRRCTDALGDHC